MIASRLAGISGLMFRTGTGDRVRTASMIAPPVPPPNAWRPVAISYITRPSEKMSVRASSSSPRICSGDIYEGVPLMIPTIEVDSPGSRPESESPPAIPLGTSFAKPKSSTFAFPRFVMKMFVGLISR